MVTFVSSCLGIVKNHGADREGSNDRWVESLSLERNIFSPECHFPFNFALSFKDPNASVERKAL